MQQRLFEVTGLLDAVWAPAKRRVSEERDALQEIVTAEDDRVQLAVFKGDVQVDNQPQPVAFEPVKKPIGEAQDNLRLRADWFKRRTGQ